MQEYCGPLKQRIHLANFHIAGFGYWDGCEAFNFLEIGTEVDLVREADNKIDAYAVAIYYNNFKLGYVPRCSNREISKYLDMGWGDLYEARITRISPDLRPEAQIEIVVYINKKEEEEEK